MLLAVCCGMASAQTASQARKILDKTAAVIGHKGGATAKFNMKGKYGNASGTIAIKGNKFCAHTDAATIWYDGKTQWTYNKKNDEVNVSTPTEAQQQQMNPYKFITIYKNGFNMSMTSTAAVHNIHLVAQDKRRTIKEMYIVVNRRTNLPEQVKMRQQNGWSTIKITNFKPTNQSDATFRFNAKDFPHAEVIDLR